MSNSIATFSTDESPATWVQSTSPRLRSSVPPSVKAPARPESPSFIKLVDVPQPGPGQILVRINWRHERKKERKKKKKKKEKTNICRFKRVHVQYIQKLTKWRLFFLNWIFYSNGHITLPINQSIRFRQEMDGIEDLVNQLELTCGNNIVDIISN